MTGARYCAGWASGVIVVLALLACVRAMAAQPGAPTPLVIGPGFTDRALGAHLTAFEDPGGRLEIADVISRETAQRFAPVGERMPNFGYTASHVWLAFTLINPEPFARDLLLEVAFPALDRVELYVPGVDGFVQRGGDRLPFAARPVPHRNHVFPLRLEPSSTTRLHLRVASRGVLTVPLQLWTPEAFSRHDYDTQVTLGVFYGLVLALFLYNLVLAVTLRDRVYALYVAYVAAFGLFLCAFDGLAYQYLWPDSTWLADRGLQLALAGALTFGVLFARAFLALDREKNLYGRVLAGIAVGGAAMLAATIEGALLGKGTILRVISVLGFAGAALTLVAGIDSLRRGNRSARFFLLAWSALLVFIVLGALRNFALMPTSFLTLYGLHIGLALDVLLLSFALADRISRLREQTQRAQTRLLESQGALLEASRTAERELEARIVERTAELNRANERLREEAAEREQLMTQLREREEHLRFMAQHDPLTGLPNRSSLQQRLELALQVARRNRRKLAVMMVDLDGFKQINDERGHLVGDQALAAVAARLRTSVRGSDTVARYGGDEFVVLAGDLERLGDAGMIAEKISDTINVPLAVDGGSARVACSIGISVFPDDAQEGKALIDLADKAMYAAKAAKPQRYAFYRETTP